MKTGKLQHRNTVGSIKQFILFPHSMLITFSSSCFNFANDTISLSDSKTSQSTQSTSTPPRPV